MVLKREQVKNKFIAERRTTHECVRTVRFETQPGLRMHRGVEIRSGKRDPHGTADVAEPHGMPPWPLGNSPGKCKSHGTNGIQTCSQASCIENIFGCGDSEAALSIGWIQRHVGVRSGAEDALHHARGRVIGGTHSCNERTSKYRFQALETEGPLRHSSPLAMLAGRLHELQFTSEIVDEAASALNGADPDKNLRRAIP